MTQEKFNEIMDLHKKWLAHEEGGVCANLSNKNLKEIDFSGADFLGANLSGADLSKTNLSKIRFYKADLSNAYFIKADLSGADLSGTSLINTKFYWTSLYDSNLYNADLSNASLFRADLGYANLEGAILKNTNLMNTIGDMKYIKNILIDKYHISYTYDILQIDSKRYFIKEWENLTNNEALKIDEKFLKWWIKYKSIIMKIIEVSPAMQ